MALDGAFLRHIKGELEASLLGARVDKVHQPNREELLIAFRTREAAYKVLFSARANSARVHFTAIPLENPKQPPMLCMLLRKKLQGARLTAIRQPELERLLHFDFDAINELGDHVTLTLTMEVMGRYSNIILSDENGKIIDALKRVDAEMSSQRLVLPGLSYRLPPPQDKLCPLSATSQQVVEALKALPRDMELSKGYLSVLQGLSPIVCRELAHQVGRGRELTVKTLDEEQLFRAGFFFQQLKDTIQEVSGRPYMAVSPQGKPMDFSFMDIHQYGSSAVVKEGESFSALLDDFYRERDKQERMRVREQDLLRLLSTHSERLSRKIGLQRGELEQCAGRDSLRVAGDLVSAHMYQLEKGQEWVDLPGPAQLLRGGQPPGAHQTGPSPDPLSERPEILQGIPQGQDRRGKAHRADRPGGQGAGVLRERVGRPGPGRDRAGPFGDPGRAAGAGLSQAAAQQEREACGGRRAHEVHHLRRLHGAGGPKQPAERPPYPEDRQ